MPLKRILAWIVFPALFGAWLFSASIWPGNSAIYNAVLADDAKEISHLLAQGADPNSQSEPLILDRNRTELKKYRYPPLIYACAMAKQPRLWRSWKAEPIPTPWTKTEKARSTWPQANIWTNSPTR
ncbi:sulfurtransferase [Novimethylophilus kurashikiensis]|uniref:Sulfurtransferase n=1 Tax=Novimethylophilus kurashikiensis TaxID=1825523 RepID=A0A2R5F2G3_9PROT|nr:hypothetical protein [Novimethylophilus kurashikiensis]GBG12800.1 sulfurtransferase [Novimethylophilus kurashikiensis]